MTSGLSSVSLINHDKDLNGRTPISIHSHNQLGQTVSTNIFCFFGLFYCFLNYPNLNPNSTVDQSLK